MPGGRSAACRTFGLALAGLMLMTAAGCVRLGSKPPERLIAIETEARIAPGISQTGPAESALFVEMPSVPKAIATQRVAVQTDATSFAYVPKALWVDTPAHQFQALLSETIAAKTGRLVLDPSQYPAQPGRVLNGELIAFGVDARANRAVVTFDARLLAADGQTVRRQRFSASEPVAQIDGESVAPAISRAANQVASQVADWIAQP